MNRSLPLALAGAVALAAPAALACGPFFPISYTDPTVVDGTLTNSDFRVWSGYEIHVNVCHELDLLGRHFFPEWAGRELRFVPCTSEAAHRADYGEAAAFYRKAAAMADAERRFGDIASTLRQLRLLADAIGPDADAVLAGLALPCVAVFAGHLIDAPGRPEPRFPADAEENVRLRLREIVRERRIAFGYSSCACGGDILFLEEVIAAGGRVVVAPPLPLEKSIARSVAKAPSDWEERLRAVLANPRAMLLEAECDETGEGDAIVYSFCNRHLFGLASLKARELGFPLRGVCVWDGRRGATPGGTSSAVLRWQMAGLPVDIVPPLEAK